MRLGLGSDAGRAARPCPCPHALSASDGLLGSSTFRSLRVSLAADTHSNCCGKAEVTRSEGRPLTL